MQTKQEFKDDPFREPINYTVKFYSVDAPATAIKTINGSSDNGLINAEWNLIDDVGAYRPEDVFLSTVTATWPNANGYTLTFSTPASSKVNDGWPSWPEIGSWVVAYQNIAWSHSPKPQYYEKLDVFATVLDTAWAARQSGYGRAYPVPGESISREEYMAYRLEFNGSYQQTREAQWSKVAKCIAEARVRNIWLLGHGSPTTIGGDFQTAAGAGYSPGSKSGLWADQVAASLGNSYTVYTIPDSGIPIVIQLAGHPYRFVNLDACSTASGFAWPRAFGIFADKQVDNVNEYLGSFGWNRRPSTFLGWSALVERDRFPTGVAGAPLSTRGWMGIPYGEYKTTLVMGWLNGQTINQAILNARSALVPLAGGQQWLARNKDKHKIIGYSGMRLHTYNQADVNQATPD
jgi:hypothetical protein